MTLLFLKVKNLFPYLLLISIYFFFINIEARNTRINSKLSIQEKDVTFDNNDGNLRISIPVIPYSKNN